jgi:predicted N-acetyltransferase YhbS
MPDMLVKLYELPDVEPRLRALQARGVIIRPGMPHEKNRIVAWVRDNFGDGWASESEVGFSNRPVSCLIAIEDGRPVGFAGHECTRRDFFGPMGVLQEQRGRGIGAALLLSCLHALRALGYAYAVIGGAGPTDFYRKIAGATIIEGSEPGVYGDPLK